VDEKSFFLTIKKMPSKAARIAEIFSTQIPAQISNTTLVKAEFHDLTGL
jgi:hypothetical protein